MTERLSEVDHWDREWTRKKIPQPLDPKDQRLKNFHALQLHAFLRNALSAIDLPADAGGANRRRRLIEVGCGGSVYLPYFAKEFGFNIAGIDYSSEGCELSDAVNRAAGVEAEIVEADVFQPPEAFLGAFDVVFSAGFVEHFSPTQSIVQTLVRLARPGGYLLTLIPNMASAVGALQKAVNRPVYDIHVPLTLQQLEEAHRDCGLTVLRSGYVGTINWSVVNFQGEKSLLSQKFGRKLTRLASRPVWWLQRHGLPDMPNRYTSPTIACFAQRPA